eukprot:s1962_g6.t1
MENLHVAAGNSASSRIGTAEEDRPDGLDTVVLDCDQTVATSGTEVVFPLRSSLRKHGAKQQNCLEEWSRRHEQLRKEAFLRMQTLLQNRRRPSQGTTFASIPACYKSSSDLSDTSSEDNAMKDVGETGGTPDVQQATRQGTAWTPATVDWCRWVFLILDDPDHFIIGKVISAFIILTILVSTTTFILESMPSFQYRPPLCEELLLAGQPITKIACEPVPDESFFYLEIVCIAIFTIEYLARLLTCHTEPNLGSGPLWRTLRYARTPLNIIDILAVAPFYLGFLLGNSVSSLRVLRLFRVVRLFKLAKHHGGIRLILEAMANSGFTLAILMFFNVIVGLFFACVIYYMEGQQFSVAEEFTRPTVDAYNNTVPAPHPFGVYVRTDAQGVRQIETPFRSIPVCLWWVFTTMTTVGYGDMVPTTPLGKVVGVVCFYCGVILLALPIGVLSTNFEQAYAKNNGKDSIQNLVLSLHRRTSTTVQVGSQRRATSLHWLLAVHDPTDAIPMTALPSLQDFPKGSSELAQVDRYLEITPESYAQSIGPTTSEKEVNDMRRLIDILWGDPRGGGGYGPSYRKGKGVYMFGPDVTETFCRDNNLQCVIRSHEVKADGYRPAARWHPLCSILATSPSADAGTMAILCEAWNPLDLPTGVAPLDTEWFILYRRDLDLCMDFTENITLKSCEWPDLWRFVNGTLEHQRTGLCLTYLSNTANNSASCHVSSPGSLQECVDLTMASCQLPTEGHLPAWWQQWRAAQGRLQLGVALNATGTEVSELAESDQQKRPYMWIEGEGQTAVPLFDQQSIFDLKISAFGDYRTLQRRVCGPKMCVGGGGELQQRTKKCCQNQPRMWA